MPSGPKKRLRAKRKQQGSPATDTNSDRETEAVSVTGSVDVDDLESGVDTPTVKVSSRPSSLEREAMSSQTDEWVRVSDFDIGTPTSQMEENDPSTEDGDSGSSRRSLNKLTEWETVSGEHIPGRQEVSIRSLEEERPECEAASVHFGESYTNLRSPFVAGRDKDSDSSDSNMKSKLTNRSGCCSSYSRGTQVKGAPASAETFDLSASLDMRGEVSLPSDLPSLRTAGDGHVEETERLGGNYVAEAIVPGTDPVASVDSDDIKVVVYDTTLPKVETSGTESPAWTEANQGESHEQVMEEGHTASSGSALAATNPDELETISANGENISEVGPLLGIPIPLEETPEDKEADGSHSQGSISGQRRLATSAGPESGAVDSIVLVPSMVDGENKVYAGGKIANPTMGESAVTYDKEVASTSADVEGEKRKDGSRHSEVSNFEGKSSFDPRELTADSISVKGVPTSETPGSRGLGDEYHHPLSTRVEKNGNEKRLIETKSSGGCWGVLYWLLGLDN